MLFAVEFMIKIYEPNSWYAFNIWKQEKVEF